MAEFLWGAADVGVAQASPAWDSANRRLLGSNANSDNTGPEAPGGLCHADRAFLTNCGLPRCGTE
jgi:hypothetical protein